MHQDTTRLRERLTSLAHSIHQRAQVNGDVFDAWGDEIVAIRDSLARPAQRLHASAIAALQAQASAPGGEVTEWREAFVHVSAMRYMDNGLMHDAAYEAAEQDARVTESANRAAPTAKDTGAVG